MQDLQLSEIFGANSSQDSVNLTLKKADLLGLIPSSVNRAEELLVSLLLTALNQFQGELAIDDDHILVTENNEPLVYDNSEDYFSRVNYWRKQVVTRNGQAYIQFQLVIFDYQLYD